MMQSLGHPGARRHAVAGATRWLLGFLTSLVLAPVVCATSLVATLDRDTIAAGETVNLMLAFQGVSPTATPNLPPLAGLNVVGTSRSSQITIENGVQSSQTTFRYTLLAVEPGEITIPALSVQVGGQTLISQPLRLKVTAASGPGGNAGAPTNWAFLKLVVPKSEVYLGEAFPVEMQLYFRDGQDVRMPQLAAEGFSLGQSAKPVQTSTTLGGVGYNLIIFKTSAVAARPGHLSLGPATCEMNLRLPIGNARSRDPFDPFGFFGPRVQLKPAVLNSPAVALHVLPLPSENVPPTFNGAVGQFQLNVTAGPTNLAVGDPITVRVELGGRGLIANLTLPTQPDWRDFKTYPPTSSVETSDPLGLTGRKVFEQVVIPENHEVQALPPFQFTYFDPVQKGYRTLLQPAIPLQVRPSAMAATPSLNLTNAQPRQPVESDDIVHIKPRLDPGRRPAMMLARHPAFFPAQTIPVIAWLALRIWRRRTERLANNPRLRRQREVAAKVRAGLAELKTLAEQRKSDEFFALLFRLLQEQIGATLDLPASGITESVLDERLNTAPLTDTSRHTLRELFRLCDQARYAPVRTGQELAALIPKAQATFNELQRLGPQEARVS
ncbi:MAG TPA: BatD family protein [Methylomirabilota bacterium]|nr:BatD family protein [Methylomirabilota bacterium]